MKPKRTIRFVLFSGEEQGLHGSKFHVTNNKEEMARVSACFVHDTGTGRVLGVGTGGRSQRALLEEELVNLRPLGVTLAIDDFGTGFSSLSVIRKLAVDRIKIDKSFIRDITEDASIPGLIVALANQLGMQTLAEGVETLEHVQALRALGVREAQGFLFSKAVASEELSGLLARGRMAVPGHVPN